MVDGISVKGLGQERRVKGKKERRRVERDRDLMEEVIFQLRQQVQELSAEVQRQQRLRDAEWDQVAEALTQRAV